MYWPILSIHVQPLPAKLKEPMSTTAMAQDFSVPRKIRFAWILPLGALLLSTLLLWPARLLILWDLGIHLPPWLEQIMGMGMGLWPQGTHTLATMVMALNLPGGIIELPLAIFSNQDSLHPAGIDLVLWNAITWPCLSVPFWWASGRAMDALINLKSAQLLPRIGWVQTVIGSLFMVIGAAGFIGILIGFLFFSTHDDKKDMANFMRTVAGLGLWAMLGSLSVIARFRQWRLLKSKSSHLSRKPHP